MLNVKKVGFVLLHTIDSHCIGLLFLDRVVGLELRGRSARFEKPVPMQMVGLGF